MAGAGYKLFSAGDILSATDVNTYMMQQTVMVFANASARTSALSSVLAEGMVSYLQDTNSLEVYDGSAWVGATGDITGLTAGTGISITDPSGAVPTVAIDTAVVPRLGVANSFTVGPQTLNTGAAGSIGLIVKGAASQSATLQEWQDSAGSPVATLAANGDFRTANIFNINSFNNSQVNMLNTGVRVTSNVAANVILTVKGAASQTANLFEGQTSAGTVQFAMNNGGDFTAQGASRSLFVTNRNNTGSYIDLSSNVVGIWSRLAGTVALSVKGAASQTANLQEWQNSAGTVLARIDSNGGIQAAVAYAGTYSYYSAMVNVTTFDAARKGLVVRGVTSQTGNLFEAQDSTGTVLASVSSAGIVRGASVRSLNDYTSLLEANSGGYVRITKQTAATPNPGSGLASLYFRDGTNAGTLKLVVRAGAAGAETTILDNIPQ
jgi:hypothetical protein